MIHIGTSGFQYPEWKGLFYPPDLAAAKMLPFYAAHFSTTESNYTFRQMPKESTLLKWADLTPEEFRFSLKASQRITHFAKLRDCEDTVRYFCAVARVLGEKLGTILFQLPPSLAKDLTLLSRFLETLPSGMRFAFEFRHLSWFDDAVYDALRRTNAALCIAHTEDFATPIVSTADHGYLRLRQVSYTPEALAEWARVVTQQTQWTDAFVYFKHEEAATGPALAQRLKELLSQV